jgi:hypothetical protein
MTNIMEYFLSFLASQGWGANRGSFGLLSVTLPLSYISSAYVLPYCILSSIVCIFFIENDAEILCAHYTWKVELTNLIHKQVFR